MRIHIISLMLFATLFSCQKDSDKDGTYAYFGGEIINPNNDYVLLLSPNHKFDTLFLDDSNRFFKKIDNLKPGLYTFTHGGEYQMALLEGRDSVMVRLNTVDFDESLVFTGDGAKKNNFLIKIFLENEKDQENFINVSQLTPERFDQYIDSARTKRIDEFLEFSDKNRLSELFNNVAETSINYGYFSAKEMYPFGYYGYRNLRKYQDLPSTFYDYRKDIDYNNAALSDYFIYNRFLYSHFNNVALNAFYKDAPVDTIFNRHSLIYNLEKLKLMDEYISNDTIKNKLLKNTTRDFISMCEDSTETAKLIASYLDKSTNPKDKAYIKRLSVALKQLKPGKILPNVELLSYENERYKLSDLIAKPTVIYFWSSNLKIHYKNSHFKSQELRKKYPNIDFIAININDNDNRYWKKTLNEFKFSTSNEYQFANPDDGKQTLAINTIYKMIVIDKDMRIVDSYYNMFQRQFEDVLKGLNE
ncbi:MAG: TlpA family protein disulfide reductase [Gelidibacter sp.]